MIIQEEIILDEEIHIHATQQLFPHSCLKCGSSNFRKYGIKSVTITDAPREICPGTYLPQKIFLSIQRYRCKDCNSIFTTPISEILDISTNHRVTDKGILFIKNHLHLKSTTLSQMLGLPIRTTRVLVTELKINNKKALS